MTRSRWATAAAVITVPLLLASYISAGDEEPVAKVTRILETAESPKRDEAGSDSPTAGARIAGKAVAIKFERGSRTAIGTIQIPSIRLKTDFYDGVTDESVELGPGHWPGTPWPGERGNSVFAGHRTTHTAPFEDLDLLKKGDRIRARLGRDATTTFRVFRKTTVIEAEYVDFVLEQPRKQDVRMITLFACTPKGSRTHRIVVQAKAAPPETRRSGEEEGRPMGHSS